MVFKKQTENFELIIFIWIVIINFAVSVSDYISRLFHMWLYLYPDLRKMWIILNMCASLYDVAIMFKYIQALLYGKEQTYSFHVLVI